MSALETTVRLLTKADKLELNKHPECTYIRCTGAKLHYYLIRFKQVLPESMLLNFRRTECYFQTYLFLFCLVQFLFHFSLEQ